MPSHISSHENSTTAHLYFMDGRACSLLEGTYGRLEQDIIYKYGGANRVKTTNNNLGSSTHVSPKSVATYPYKSFT